MNIKVVNPIPQKEIDFIYETFLNERQSSEFEEIGCGCQGVVYKYKNYAIKDYWESCGNDGIILEKLQGNPLFPKLYCYDETFMVMEFLDIQPAYEYHEKNVEIDFTGYDVFKYCYNKGYIPYDIHDENVVVTKNDEVKIIDVGAFQKVRGFSLDYYISQEPKQLEELNSIIMHIKRPPIAI